MDADAAVDVGVNVDIDVYVDVDVGVCVNEDVDIDDPEENPFHEDLASLKMIMAGMVKRTKEAQDQGDAYAPLTFLLLDDVAAGSGPATGTRYNDDVLKLFTQSRHSGGVVALLTQSYTL